MLIPLMPCLQFYQCYSTMQSDWSSLLFLSFYPYQGGEDRPRLRHVGRADHALGRQQQHRAGHRGDRGHSCSLWKQCHCRQLPRLPRIPGLKRMVPRSARWGLWQPLALQSPLQMPLRWGLRVCWQELQPQAGERLEKEFPPKPFLLLFFSVGAVFDLVHDATGGCAIAGDDREVEKKEKNLLTFSNLFFRWLWLGEEMERCTQCMDMSAGSIFLASYIIHIHWIWGQELFNRSLQHLSRYGLTGFLTSRPALPDLLAPRTLHACTDFRRSRKHPEQVRSYFVVTCLSYFFLTIFWSDENSLQIVQSFIVTGGHAGDGVGLYTTEILLPGKNHTSPEWCLFNGFGWNFEHFLQIFNH